MYIFISFELHQIHHWECHHVLIYVFVTIATAEQHVCACLLPSYIIIQLKEKEESKDNSSNHSSDEQDSDKTSKRFTRRYHVIIIITLLTYEII